MRNHNQAWTATKTRNTNRLRRVPNPVPAAPMTATEVCRSFGGRLTYRMLDYWVRTGIVQIENNPGGSGNRRTFTPAEVAAIDDILDVRARCLTLLDRFSSGDLFAEKYLEHRLKMKETA